MANLQKPPGKDAPMSVYVWRIDSPERELKQAFRKPSGWVVAQNTETHFESAILGNLGSRYVEPQEATVDYVRQSILKGFKRSAFDRLRAVLDVPAEELSKVTGIPLRTLARREVFKPDESERILRIAAAIQRAIEVMGDLKKARVWFSTGKRALAGNTPLQFCDTEPGAREVMNLLGRIEHGVFS